MVEVVGKLDGSGGIERKLSDVHVAGQMRQQHVAPAFDAPPEVLQMLDFFRFQPASIRNEREQTTANFLMTQPNVPSNRFEFRFVSIPVVSDGGCRPDARQ